MALWICTLCDYVYDESKGDPANGVAPGLKFGEVPYDWTCPDCGVSKEMFERMEDPSVR